MHVVWKRPDGFHGAEPNDFRPVDVSGKARLWLHKSDHEWYPFRIAGGWQEQEATQRLNAFVNLIGKPMSHWVDRLVTEIHNSMVDDPQLFFTETIKWLSSLKGALKGDTWEVEIMAQTIAEVEHRLIDAKPAFFLKSRDGNQR
jgi:hypothetical protein